MLACSVLYCSTESALLYSAALWRAVLCCAVLYCTVLYCTALYYGVRAVLYCTVVSKCRNVNGVLKIPLDLVLKHSMTVLLKPVGAGVSPDR
jgi:hypothetical protein